MNRIKKVVYIGGVARSGTSWLGQIFNSIPQVSYRFQPMFSYEFRDCINEDSKPEDYQRFYIDLFNNNSDFLTQRDKVLKGLYPDFKKENPEVLVFKENRFQSFIEPMLRKSENLSFVGIIRNPCATLYSWSLNEKEFPKGSDLLQEWRFANCKNSGNEDYFGYYKWKEVSNLYLDLKQKYPDRVQLVYYDDFIKNTEDKVKSLFKRLNLPFFEQTSMFLSESVKRNDTSYYSVFKGKSNRQVWKTNLPEYIINEITEDLKNTRLEEFLK